MRRALSIFSKVSLRPLRQFSFDSFDWFDGQPVSDQTQWPVSTSGMRSRIAMKSIGGAYSEVRARTQKSRSVLKSPVRTQKSRCVLKSPSAYSKVPARTQKSQRVLRSPSAYSKVLPGARLATDNRPTTTDSAPNLWGSPQSKST